MLKETNLIGSGNGADSALQAIPKRKKRTVRVEISSNDRNVSVYPKTSSFRWEFKYPLKGVSEVRLVNGTVPIPFFNIDTGWNQFTFQEDTSKYNITLTPGLYTATTFSALLQSTLNGLGLSNTYVVSVDPNTNCLTIIKSGSKIFGFLFSSGTYIDQLDRVTGGIISIKSSQVLMGFGYADFFNTNDTIVAPYPIQLNYMLRRIYVYINFDSTIDLRSIDRGQGRKEPSAILYIDNDTSYGTYRTLNHDNYDCVMNCGTAGITRVASIFVEFRDEYDNILNFNQRSATLLLEMVVVE
jgi:hypothetical protein